MEQVLQEELAGRRLPEEGRARMEAQRGQRTGNRPQAGGQACSAWKAARRPVPQVPPEELGARAIPEERAPRADGQMRRREFEEAGQRERAAGQWLLRPG